MLRSSMNTITFKGGVRLYISKNLYDKYVTYVDVPDDVFFHNIINYAKEVFESGKLENVDIEEIKSKYTPVIYVSTLSKRTGDDDLLTRKSMNERARNRYLIIDADYDVGEEDKSQELYDKLIALAKKHNTKLVVYPTISYPTKPRFRAVLFTKKVMNDASYHQAMNWLYDQLGLEATDKGDFDIRSNNNAPIFVNEAQIKRIYDNTQEEGLEPLDNHLFKPYPKPKSRKAFKKDFVALTKYDEGKVSRFQLMMGIQKLVKNPDMQDYNTFWPVVYSLAKAELLEQISEKDAFDALEELAKAAPDQYTRTRWSIGNRQKYISARASLMADEQQLLKTRSLFSREEFKI